MTMTSLTTGKELPIKESAWNLDPQNFKDYCQAHKIYYYARPKEDFSLSEARTLAHTASKNWLILDNLS